jgi:hypothetical protein
MALKTAPGPLLLVVSGDIYRSVIQHDHDVTGQAAFHRLLSADIAGTSTRAGSTFRTIRLTPRAPQPRETQLVIKTKPGCAVQPDPIHGRCERPRYGGRCGHQAVP